MGRNVTGRPPELCSSVQVIDSYRNFAAQFFINLSKCRFGALRRGLHTQLPTKLSTENVGGCGKLGGGGGAGRRSPKASPAAPGGHGAGP